VAGGALQDAPVDEPTCSLVAPAANRPVDLIVLHVAAGGEEPDFRRNGRASVGPGEPPAELLPRGNFSLGGKRQAEPVAEEFAQLPVAAVFEVGGRDVPYRTSFPLVAPRL